MSDGSSWRPREGGIVALSDEQLARIGLAVVLEAQAKGAAAAVLRVLDGLSGNEWIELERVQFRQIMERLITASAGVDGELEERISVLERARLSGHELRNIVVHVSWGEGGEGPVGYDYGRKRLLDSSDIDAALSACAELKRAAHWCAYRVGELIQAGRFPERAAGQGMSIRTEKGPVRL